MESVRESGGEAKIFSSMHISGERKSNFIFIFACTLFFYPLKKYSFESTKLSHKKYSHIADGCSYQSVGVCDLKLNQREFYFKSKNDLYGRKAKDYDGFLFITIVRGVRAEVF